MIDGLIESIRFGFSVLGNAPTSPPTGTTPVRPQYQSGLPPGGLRFGFRPLGNVGGAPGTGNGVPQYQSGLPPVALRFGFKVLGQASVAVPLVHSAYETGLPPSAIRFGFNPNGTPVAAEAVTSTPRQEIINSGAGAHRGPYSPVTRSIRDLYRPIELETEQQPVSQPSEVSAQPEALQLQPAALPLVMDFGAGPKIIGIKPSLSQDIANEIEADDEDAMIATLMALTNR